MNTALQQNAYQNSQTAYKQASVETSSPEKLITMLYSKVILLLHQTEKAFEEKKLEEIHNNLLRVQDIISELDRTLDMENGGEIAQNLRELYRFYYMETIKANVKKDASFLPPVLNFFEAFRDVWIEAARISRLGAK
ncbi:MAG: flagellar export chaperone FliS [Dehalobacter sp. 4CP]|uniref:flagellar export chaperone FliS n=1 Tax=Dehalobacter sp. CP TaxID=2594474 RepID=UPI0013C6DD8D|nr:flagellar export chaperone FliS [Dehalobacter sp.]NBJ15360.1 flagellar export chaperone FliS [Dehalobacter sp. 4CP]